MLCHAKVDRYKDREHSSLLQQERRQVTRYLNFYNHHLRLDETLAYSHTDGVWIVGFRYIYLHEWFIEKWDCLYKPEGFWSFTAQPGGNTQAKTPTSTDKTGD